MVFPMAVYTSVSAATFEDVLKAYPLGSLLSAEGIREGVENTNYLLVTDQGRYIATIYEKRVAAADLPFFLALMEHLAERGIPCPLPVHDRNGTPLRTVEGKPFAIVTFLPGRWPKTLRAEHCLEVGRMLARIHQAVADFTPTRPNALSVPGWRRLIEGVRSAPSPLVTRLMPEITEALDKVEVYWPSGLPSGVIHGDFFPDNVFFEESRISGVLDFYFACTDIFAYDLAIALNAWCFEPDIAFNITKARALLSGYTEVRPLTEEERENLPVLACGASLRFLASRLYDWVHRVDGAVVTPKDPMDYMRRLRFHRQVRGVSEYGI